MLRKSLLIASFVVLAMIVSGCGGAVSTPALSGSPTPTVGEASPAADQPTAAPQVTPEYVSKEPQRVEFQSADGTTLVGTYWPPAQSPAPGVILMHMMGHNKEDWSEFAALLQGVGIARLSPMTGQARSYAVLAFDFRGHGESGGSSSDRAGMIADAQAALAYFRTLPSVDPGRVVMIGASIGADAAVDACGEGCTGAVSLSPGGYLGVAYNDALTTLGDRPVLCVASEGDAQSAETCRRGEQAGVTDYQVQIYAGSAHGTDMFAISDQQPFLTDLLFQWLGGHIQ